MGRVHHDGQELEHLPERRLGEEHGRVPGKKGVAQFGAKLCGPPPPLFFPARYSKGCNPLRSTHTPLTYY
jgi:hypothetical protein